MPPKRKRAGDKAEAAPRATRTSSRLKTTTDVSSETSSAPSERGTKVGTAMGGGDLEVEPAAKKAKRAPKTAGGRGAKAKSGPEQAEASPKECASTSLSKDATSSKPAQSKQVAKPEPYSEDNARRLFKQYEDADSPGTIGPEGFETLCADLEISLEGALPLMLAWQLHATEMAKFKESEWMQGTGELRASSPQTLSLALRDLEDLLILDKPPVQPSGNANAKKKGAAKSDLSGPYDRTKYYRYAADKQKAFGELYAFCFGLAKPPGSRSIDMETACAFWSVLVAPKYPIMNDILEFIKEKGTYKGVNKDIWNMVLDFSRTVKPDLSNFDAEGAWPSMLDDFVAWKKPEGSGAQATVDVDA